VIVHPRPGGGLTHAAALLQSRYGRIAVAWRIDPGYFTLTVEIPPNATATVMMPDGRVHELGSGDRTFAVPYTG
jgi:alpha-L-rhamnosidase